MPYRTISAGCSMQPDGPAVWAARFRVNLLLVARITACSFLYALASLLCTRPPTRLPAHIPLPLTLLPPAPSPPQTSHVPSARSLITLP